MYLKALCFIIQGHILAKKSHKLTASLYARYFLFRSRSASNAFISPPRTHFFMYVCNSWVINCYVISAVRRTKMVIGREKGKESSKTDEACDTLIAMLCVAMRSLTHVRCVCEWSYMLTQLNRLRKWNASWEK